MTYSMSTHFKAAALGASALVALAGAAKADQVFNDDVIVVGSLCVGIDCVNGESFGFDTIRLKENNLRIKFQDTSSSASFPTNDWELTANDSGNGGANRFSIRDVDAGRDPFTVTAGARANSIFVNNAGRVGFGTATPSVDLHVRQGNSPTLRLEQDGSSGFAAQTWDIAGNETNFFIRDVTNSSKLPFRIKPNSPDDSIFVQNNGDIGMGTDNPQDALHIVSASSAAIRLEATGAAADNPVRINLNGNNDELRVTWDGLTPARNQLRLDEAGKLTITGTMATGSTCIEMANLACTFADGAGSTCVVGDCP